MYTVCVFAQYTHTRTNAAVVQENFTYRYCTNTIITILKLF